MWIELASMLVVSFCAAIALCTNRVVWLWPFLLLLLGAAFGTIGIGLVGAFAFLYARRFFRTAFATFLLLACLLLFFRSGSGRLLGVAEGLWMAVQTGFSGVGWGRWTWHQAEAQRAVLEAIPFSAWKEAASYFGVAPSLPFHLLAETGWIGASVWILGILLAFAFLHVPRAIVRAPALFLFTFLFASSGTTPVQFFLTVDAESVLACDRAIDRFRESPSRDLSPLRACPEIRTLEWTAASEGTPDAFLRWHETFPRDVMPSYMLGRIAATEGREAESLHWFEEASQGNPGNDPSGRALQEEAKRICNGDRSRFRLWKATSKGDRRRMTW
jgi:hypothetical protein